MSAATKSAAKIGDLVVIEGHHVGEGRRMGEILEVIDATGNAHYRVRWDDGRETLFYPGNDAIIRPAESRPRRARKPVVASPPA